MDYDIQVDDVQTPDFDDRGVPLTVENAQLMTAPELTQAVTNLIADLEATSFQEVRSWDKAEDGTPAIDSHLAVDVFNEFTAHLSIDPVDLANVPEKHWTSIGGIVIVLLEAFSSFDA